MTIEVLTGEIKEIGEELLREDGKLYLRESSFYKNLDWQEFRLFCHKYARYGISTTELIDYIKNIIADRSCIEIGAGAGDLGFHLGVKMTDSKQQEDSVVRKAYEAMKQPIIKYPKDVEKIDALDAVKKYKPQVVVASWITPYSKYKTTFGSNPYGIKEKEILDIVETFIIVGNLDQHHDKPIRYFHHDVILEPWIVSRAKDQSKNCIFLWDSRKC